MGRDAPLFFQWVNVTFLRSAAAGSAARHALDLLTFGFNPNRDHCKRSRPTERRASLGSIS